MDLFTISSIVISLSALFGYVNVKFLRLPNTIGLMVVAITFTLILFASSMFTDTLLRAAERLVGMIDFETVLLDVMLGFLLFAGAKHTNLCAAPRAALAHPCLLDIRCTGSDISHCQDGVLRVPAGWTPGCLDALFVVWRIDIAD